MDVNKDFNTGLREKLQSPPWLTLCVPMCVCTLISHLFLIHSSSILLFKFLAHNHTYLRVSVHLSSSSRAILSILSFSSSLVVMSLASWCRFWVSSSPCGTESLQCAVAVKMLPHLFQCEDFCSNKSKRDNKLAKWCWKKDQMQHFSRCLKLKVITRSVYIKANKMLNFSNMLSDSFRNVFWTSPTCSAVSRLLVSLSRALVASSSSSSLSWASFRVEICPSAVPKSCSPFLTSCCSRDTCEEERRTGS